MTMDEMIASAGWVETVIARNETAALVAATGRGGPIEALLYLTPDGRSRVTQWHRDVQDGRASAAWAATNDGANQADVFAAVDPKATAA